MLQHKANELNVKNHLFFSLVYKFNKDLSNNINIFNFRISLITKYLYWLFNKLTRKKS